MKLENTSLGSAKAKVEEKSVQLKLELEHNQANFIEEKKKLETAYQQVDDMFFCGYHCCMKKHRIIDDILSIPSDDDNEVMLGDNVVADGQEAKDEEAEG